MDSADYKVFVEETGHEPPSHWNGKWPKPETENLPVTDVAWSDTKAFAEWRAKRLPSEEEWEKAATGHQGNEFPWGNLAGSQTPR